MDSYDRPYIDTLNARPTEVHCKGACRTTIALGSPSGALVPTEDYRELVIAMQEADGQLSKHETGVCRACKERILGCGPRLDELDAIYRQDVLQWVRSATDARSDARDIAAAAQAMRSRRPIRALDEFGRGEVHAE